MNLRRNLALYTPYRILSLEAVCHGVYLLWLLREKQLSPAAIAIIHAAGDALLVLLELPTGVFADRFGCRLSLLLGSSLQVAGCLGLWLGRSALELGAGSLLIAAGDAFRSGAQDALLYRSCRDGEEFGRIRSRASVHVQLALMSLGMLGGLLGDINLHLPLALETAVCTAGLFVALAMREAPVAAARTEGSRQSGWLFQVDWRTLVASSAIILAACSGGFLAPVEAAKLGAAPSTTALMVAGLMLACTAGAYAASKLSPDAYSSTLRTLLLAAAAVAAAVAAAPALALPAVALLHVLSGAVDPIRAELLQRSADDSRRATVASLGGLMDVAFKTAGLPLAAQLHGAGGAPAVAAGVLAVLGTALVRLRGPRA